MKQVFHIRFLIATILITTYISSFAESGGPLSPAQAAYDVNYYDLDLMIDPVTKTIDGSLLCRVEILDPIDTLVLDLDNPFSIDSVLFKLNESNFISTLYEFSAGKVYINIPESVVEGDFVSVHIYYNGAPRIASNPPWGVGFVWETTPSGDPWIGVACEDDGADIWWPCKDHPSDEPDSMSMSFTVPNPLICVSNGQYMGSVDNGNGTSTFNWFISTPINNYNVSIYAAEFMLIEDEYLSINGDMIPFYFWVLPESYNTAVNYMDVFLTEFNFLESICGPFPFGTDKHGWAHAPYWGMEHQTIIAYGHNFTVGSWGYDYIHYHELAHEWWGNLITAENWADVWIHEGIATYTEALYVEYLSGMESYHQFMDNKRPNDNHSYPLAPYDELTAAQAFDYLNSYNRGASVMHTLRYHLGDEMFFNLIKRWAYPDSTDTDNTNGRLCRILTTEDLMIQAEEVTNQDLDPFFDVFMREAAYPILNVLKEYDETTFTWETENNVLLDVDIPILVNGDEYIIEMTEGQGSIVISLEDELVIDPKNWILMAEPSIVTSIFDNQSNEIGFRLEQNYPNPFTHSTMIAYTIPSAEYVSLKVFDLLGNEIVNLVNKEQSPGSYEVTFDGNDLSNGVYIYQFTAGNYTEIKRIILNK